MKREMRRAFLILTFFSILTGFLYPVFMTVFSRFFFSYRAGGSIIMFQGKMVGSELIGQNFKKPEYFHGRPSAGDYDAGNSGGSNLGPANGALIKRVQERADSFRSENGLSKEQKVPADMVSASASGLDPHISVEATLFQVRRVSGVRRLPEGEVLALVKECTENPVLGFFGRPRVNVLNLNIRLDRLQQEVR
ncbi:MAG: potassium-transporting ATPase subunit KdpC [Candidatus Ratteibacteria bacterium]|jgi:K+-transporting ATPase ATPase C chain